MEATQTSSLNDRDFHIDASDEYVPGPVRCNGININRLRASDELSRDDILLRHGPVSEPNREKWRYYKSPASDGGLILVGISVELGVEKTVTHFIKKDDWRIKRGGSR